jgi:hypothetical protein
LPDIGLCDFVAEFRHCTDSQEAFDHFEVVVVRDSFRWNQRLNFIVASTTDFEYEFASSEEPSGHHMVACEEVQSVALRANVLPSFSPLAEVSPSHTFHQNRMFPLG